MGISISGGGSSSGGGSWGSITGTLSTQTDLNTALAAKADDSATTTALAAKASTSSVTTSLAAKVAGPVSSTDKAIPTFSGTGGETLQDNSTFTISGSLAKIGAPGNADAVIGNGDIGIYAGGNGAYPAFVAYSATSAGDVALIRTRQSRGTVSSPSSTQSGDFVGQWDMSGYTNGLGFLGSILMYGQATENYTAGGRGTQFVIETPKNGDYEYQLRIKVDGSGNTNILNGKLLCPSLGVGNSASGSTLGTVVKKVQIFDASGSSLGYIAVYDAIT